MDRNLFYGTVRENLFNGILSLGKVDDMES